jgi:micrococcal nuclease
MSLYEYRAILVRWIDADTAVVNIDLGFRNWMHDEHLRLIGINAPDKQPAKREATAFVRELVSDGAEIIVRTEKDKGDKYGRWLAEVWEDDTAPSINAILVAAGHATRWDGTGTRPEAETK